MPLVVTKHLSRVLGLCGRLHPAPTAYHTAGFHSQHQNGNTYFANPEAFTEVDLEKVDYQRVFATKTLTDLVRAIGVLRVCSSERFVTNALKIYDTSRRLLGRRLVDAVTKHTFYNQFVGGEDVTALERTIQHLQNAGIGSILAVPMEEDMGEGVAARETWYDANRDIILRCVDFAHRFQPDYPMYQLKVTAIMPGNLVTTITKIIQNGRDEIPVESVAKSLSTGNMMAYDKLTAEENEKFHQGLLRLRDIALLSQKCNVRVLVDAEYTYMNPAITLVTLAMMLSFNTKHPLVWNTYQCYLKQTYDNLVGDHEEMTAHGVCFGVKLVRGAYIYRERMLADQLDYESPVHETYTDTCAMYDQAIDKLLQIIKKGKLQTNVIIASHNEESVRFALNRMAELDIDRQGGEVFFGQLFGMSDQITYPLGRANYLVYKSLPYGTIDDTIPYLVRRAQENRSVMAGMRKELTVLNQALRSRIRTKLKQ